MSSIDAGYEASSLELVEDVLDALSPATSVDVFLQTRDVSERAIASVAAARADAVSGGFSAYALLREEQASGTDGGDFTSGGWRTRVLNVADDPDDILTLASNQFTIEAGRYLVLASAPAFQVGRHQLKIRNVTDSSDAIIGGGGLYLDPTRGASNRQELAGRLDIDATKTFELQHRSENSQSTTGFGVACSFGVVEVYSQVVIYRETEV